MQPAPLGLSHHGCAYSWTIKFDKVHGPALRDQTTRAAIPPLPPFAKNAKQAPNLLLMPARSNLGHPSLSEDVHISRDETWGRRDVPQVLTRKNR